MARTRKGLSLDAALSLSLHFPQPPAILPQPQPTAMKTLMERTSKILERSRNCKKLKKATRKKSPVKPGILERSRNFKILKKPPRKKSPVKPRILPARASARLCVRKNSGEHDQCLMRSDIPLRTVELIKRPLELREPATKLLFLASLSLYPTADPDSDTTPIVIISEEIPNLCGKKPKMRSLEVPLLPNWKSASFQPSSRATVVDNTTVLQPIKVEKSAPVKRKRKSLDTVIKEIPKVKSQKVDAVDGNIGNSSEVKLPASELNLTENSTTLPSVNPILEELMKTPVNNKKPCKPKNEQPLTDKVVKSAPVKRKRKSLETVIKEIPKEKSQQKVDLVNGNSSEVKLPVSELNLTANSTKLPSVNPILEELMKIPVKNKKRPCKPKTEKLLPQPVAIQPVSPVNLHNPVSMVVPLQPAPGNPNLNTTGTPLAKEQKGGKQRNKKQKSQFQLPLPLPIPIPPGLLNYATLPALVPNSNLPANPPKPKRQRKPPKPKAPKVSAILEVPTNLSLPQRQPHEIPHHQHHQLASIPYLPSHLQAYYHSSSPPAGIAGNGVKESFLMSSMYHHNQDQHQPMDLDQALDLCVKAQPIVQPKKAKKPKAPAMKSLLKPMNIEEDGPLNLVMARGVIPPGGPVVAMKHEPNVSTSPSATENMQQQGNLENVKQMLARLHTKIAPAVNGVQLITIE